jgi:hypothetical protein
MSVTGKRFATGILATYFGDDHAVTAPATFTVALTATIPVKDVNGEIDEAYITEPTDTAYARQTITNDTANIVITGTTATNVAAVVFPDAAADYLTYPVGYVVYDDADLPLTCGTFAAGAIIVTAGNHVTLPAGTIQITLAG